MILLNKLCSLQNRISKSELIQTVPIPKPCDFCKTIMILPHTPLRRIFSNTWFTGLICNPQGYTTWWRATLPLMTEVAHAMILSFFNNIKRRYTLYVYFREISFSCLKTINMSTIKIEMTLCHENSLYKGVGCHLSFINRHSQQIIVMVYIILCTVCIATFECIVLLRITRANR